MVTTTTWKVEAMQDHGARVLHVTLVFMDQEIIHVQSIHRVQKEHQ